ncbi:MAG: hypothetical protein LBN03_00825 [Bifidobacteriaceae bacterium]|jgi:hypothetical protein|nr:hypothetical protein [Bifidobacteriaceae bacterium]
MNNQNVIILTPKALLSIFAATISIFMLSALLISQMNTVQTHAIPQNATADALSIQKGGTGATTLAAARDNLGLGNTTGVLPIANGGTNNTTGVAVSAKSLLASGVNAGTDSNARRIWMFADDYWNYDNSESCPTGVKVGDVVIVTAISGYFRQTIIGQLSPCLASGWGLKDKTKLQRISVTGDSAALNFGYYVLDTSNSGWV